ncbi:MAG: Stk1 family PASTA domain-containing Ser/Thr kinase [Tyzzerella sp.]|uniref:non-specific serine/threonine protein kinase n=1 Tax=Candidatus Fimicola merdigallinarum TaxID=2840819 RepID=A0A9D9DXV8_9FIRM|nr:Stk1 family PASTA domain-containing Ser/Thr kinase [Candidatus Fimicola merdigallinarum]
MILASGTVLSGRYEILQKLGSGGMAVAYCGRDKVLDRFVTIKILREEFSSDDEFKEKFKVEARSAASLSDPNIVSVYDVGEYEGISYIVMEYIHGDTLKKAIKEKAPFDTKTIVNISLQIASALSNAHKNKVVHRDIKPQNILISSDGIVKVTDFGIARATTGSTVETKANAVGSVYYFSPEQARGGYVDEKSDIYSLGITMYEMATGKVPFDGENAVTIALKHLNDELPDMRQFNPKLSDNLEKIIKKATMKKASDRYANIDLMVQDLFKVMSDSDTDSTYSKIEEEPKESDVIIPTPTPSRRSRMERRQENLDSKLKISNDNDDFESEYVEESVPKNNRKTYDDEDDDYEDDYDKGQERKVIVLAVITALIIICGITFAGFKFLGGGSKVSAELVPVPAFVGEDFEDAQSMAEELGIKLVQVGEEYSNYEAGVIFAQSVEEGESIKQGSELSVKVSLGLEEHKMIDVTGLDEKDATEAINDEIGIDPDVEYEFSDDVEIGKVIKQTPSKGTTVTSKSDITIFVSKGEEFKKVSVPNLVGKTEDEAKKLLESKGLILGTVTETESDTVEKGKVITQTISSGEEIAKNSVVNIIVSKGSSKTDEDKKEEKPETDKKEEKPTTNSNINKNEDKKEENSNNNEKPQTPSKPETNNDNSSNNSNNNNETNTNETPKDEEKPTETQKTSTKNFPIYIKNDGQYGDTVHVKVVKTGEDGSVSVVKDANQPTSSFPQQISVSGQGKATVECYIDGSLIWSESVNFSEGGN